MLKTASCTCCHAVHFTSDMVKTPMPKRGNASAYMCRTCATQNRSYHTSNNVLQGKAKMNQLCVGIELETSYTNDIARNLLFEYGLIPTHDCSLDSDERGNRYGWDGSTCEYVTGIIQGLNKPSKMAVSIESMMNLGFLKINDSCGTHFHVSINNMKDASGQQVYMGYIRRFYNSLFVPLTNAMQANPEKTVAVFGRYFNHTYAMPVTEHATQTGHNDRYYFINCLADSNIEFRLNKFTSAKQFQNLMKMEVEMVKTIVTNFCEHFNDSDIDTRRYETKTAYRKHKASVTANKLVKIFEKYSENI